MEVKINKQKIKKRMSGRDRIIMFFSILMIIVSLSAVGVVALLAYKPLQGGDGGKPETIPPDIESPQDIKEKQLNFLFVGIDDNDARANQLTDIIMIVSLDIAAKKMNILQIPRDTYVGENIPTSKVNAVFKQKKNGGIAGLSKLLNSNFKINIDHYATITMKGFLTSVDKIGGVEVNVQKKVELDGITIKPGKQILNGIKAEKFIRVRKGVGYTGSDIERVKMQRVFFAALMAKIKNLPKTKAVALVPTISKELTTDLSIGEMLSIYNVISQVKLEDVKIFLTPGESLTYNGASVYTIHKQNITDILNDNFRPYTDDVMAKDLGVIELQNTTSWYEDNVDDFGSLQEGVKPGTNSSSSSSSN